MISRAAWRSTENRTAPTTAGKFCQRCGANHSPRPGAGGASGTLAGEFFTDFQQLTTTQQSLFAVFHPPSASSLSLIIFPENGAATAWCILLVDVAASEQS